MNKTPLISLATFLIISFAGVGSFAGNSGPAHGQDDLQREYAAACARTQDAMELSMEELQGYIAQCDALQTRIEQLGKDRATEKKVYLKRLQMCRDLYVFALEFKKEQQQP
jgi:hypothetical protein